MAFARRRLLLDYAEVQREPSELIAAAPLEDNIFEWHVNLRPSSGPLSGVTLHLRIVFPEDYPNSPPNMIFPFDLLPSFVHPNLYSFGLCLDILSSYVGHRVDRAGWSSAYSVQTLLLQLQSFLFEFDAAPQDHGGSYSCKYAYTQERISKVRAEAAALTCSCGHCSSTPSPPLMPSTVGMVDSNRSMDNERGLLRQLQQVQIDMRDAEQRIAMAKMLQKSHRSQASTKHTAYLSANATPKFFRASLLNFEVELQKLKVSDGQSYVRIGFGSAKARSVQADSAKVVWDSRGKICYGTANPSGCVKRASAGDVLSGHCSESSLQFNLNAKAIQVQSKVPLRERLATSGRTLLVHETCALIELCNADVCIESIGSSFEVDSLPESNEEHNHRVEASRCLQTAAESAELLPTLQARYQILLQKVELDMQRREQLKLQRLEAEVADLARPLHAGTKKNPWARLRPDLLMQVVMCLDVVAVAPVKKVCKVWWRLYTRCNIPARLQLCCFYTKAKADSEVLGFGISVEYHDDGNIKEVTTELDVISQQAYFDHKVRRGAWGGEFQYFLPLVLDGQHAQRALPTLKCALACLVRRRASTSNDFQPWMALAVIPQVMNSFVVSLMREDEGEEDAVPRHASERALLGYCSFHHMLLALQARYPEIRQVANLKLREFIQGRRSKDYVPDLGQLLVYMTVTEDVAWADLVPAVLHESQVRGVRWLLRDMPYLEGSVDKNVRLQKTFQGRMTSLRLLMFQAYFLCNVARPSGESLSASLSRYNCQFGQATEPQSEGLMRACRGILKVRSWSEFYAAMGFEAPSDAELAQGLCDAVVESRELGYHGLPALLHQDRQAFPNKVGVQRSLASAFGELERHKQAEVLQTMRQKEAQLRARELVHHQRRLEQQRNSKTCQAFGRFAVLGESDED